MKWTSREIKYLEEHAGDGAEAIAEALNRTKRSVEIQASKYGVSLRKTWVCPKCGMLVSKPLSRRTGWCAACTKERRREFLEKQVRELEEEARRNEREDRERQRLYSRKSRARKNLKKREV